MIFLADLKNNNPINKTKREADSRRTKGFLLKLLTNCIKMCISLNNVFPRLKLAQLCTKDIWCFVKYHVFKYCMVWQWHSHFPTI